MAKCQQAGGGCLPAITGFFCIVSRKKRKCPPERPSDEERLRGGWDPRRKVWRGTFFRKAAHGKRSMLFLRLCYGLWLFHLHSAVKIQPFSPVFPLAGSTAKAFCRLSLWSFKEKTSTIFYNTAINIMSIPIYLDVYNIFIIFLAMNSVLKHP